MTICGEIDNNAIRYEDKVQTIGATMTEIRAESTPWHSKKYVIATEEDVKIFKKDGTLLHTIPMPDIVGVYFKKSGMMMPGVVRFCTSWEDLRGSDDDQHRSPDSLTLEKSDNSGMEKLKDFVEEQIKKYDHKSPYEMEATGINSSVYLMENKIIIRHKGGLNALTKGLTGEKVIPIKSITAIQFKKPSGTNGYIQFATLSGEATGGVLDATRDENSVLFNNKQEAEFAAFRDRIQALIDGQSTGGVVTQQLDPLDQLKKLKELLDAGILSQDEFDEKKKTLMDKI